MMLTRYSSSYEPFLEAFDPELRKELGVWYTPNEVVTYMVAQVDKALREDLGKSRTDLLPMTCMFLIHAVARAHSLPPCLNVLRQVTMPEDLARLRGRW